MSGKFAAVVTNGVVSGGGSETVPVRYYCTVSDAKGSETGSLEALSGSSLGGGGAICIACTPGS